MAKWTTQNTQGFTGGQLRLINEAIDMIDTGTIDDSNVNDAINNAWADQDSAKELAEAAAKALGCKLKD